jgi:long-chain acyl-CoA synthetase
LHAPSQTGSVGVIVPSMEVRLKDYPEAGYLTSNKPAQGEVWLRGGSVTKGYYKRPDLNKESFTDDGWFKTGDIGQFAADGTLSLIDRIKNLVKLRSGEYLALEKLESVYGSCDISQNLCVYANSDADKPIAIVFPVRRFQAERLGWY